MDRENLPWTATPTPQSRPKPKKKKSPTSRRKLEHAQKKAEARAKLDADRPFQVTLKRSHNINGHIYGPGTLTLPGQIARECSHREYHADRQEDRFHGELAAIVGGRTAQGSHRVTFVPVETFSDAYGGAIPMDRVSGAGMIDPGAGEKF